MILTLLETFIFIINDYYFYSLTLFTIALFYQLKTVYNRYEAYQ